MTHEDKLRRPRTDLEAVVNSLQIRIEEQARLSWALRSVLRDSHTFEEFRINLLMRLIEGR